MALVDRSCNSKSSLPQSRVPAGLPDGSGISIRWRRAFRTLLCSGAHGQGRARTLQQRKIRDQRSWRRCCSTYRQASLVTRRALRHATSKAQSDYHTQDEDNKNVFYNGKEFPKSGEHQFGAIVSLAADNACTRLNICSWSVLSPAAQEDIPSTSL